MIGTRGRALPGALAVLASSAMWVLASAAPAGAYVCGFGIDSPSGGSVSGSATLRVSGLFSAEKGSADRIVEISFTRSPGPPPPPVAHRGAAVGPSDRFDVPVGPLSLNGAYTARVTARHAGTGVLSCNQGIGPEDRDTERTATVSFGVSVRAKPPVDVRASFDPGSRRATVTWGRSDDPDIAGYTITRRIGGETSAVDVPSDPLSWTDTSLPGGAAKITYSVQAARNGPAAGTTSARSEPVTAAVDVPAPSAPPTTPVPAGNGSGAGTATTKPFALGRPVGGSDSPPATALGLPGLSGTGDPAAGADQGPYRPLIPYAPGDEAAATPDGSMAIDDSNDQAMVGEGRGDLGGEGVPGLAYVAAAMLSTVVAAHVLWLRRQALRPDVVGASRRPPPLEPLEPVAAPPDDPAPDDPGPADRAPRPFQPTTPSPAPPPPARTPLRAATATSAGHRHGILRPSRDGTRAFEPAEPRAAPGPQDAPRFTPIVIRTDQPEVAPPARVRRSAPEVPAVAPGPRADREVTAPAPVRPADPAEAAPAQPPERLPAGDEVPRLVLRPRAGSLR